jgi:glycosyltransferase involved in cell wall biosynthesis
LLGKPVVATGYSGNLDFTNEKNSRLIPYETIPITHDCKVYPKGGYWADPSIESAAEALRWIVEDRRGSSAMAHRGQMDAKRILALEAYGERIRSRLEEIAGVNKQSLRRAA